MLDLALIRAEPARVKAALARRGVGPEAVDAVTELDGRWTARREVREALRNYTGLRKAGRNYEAEGERFGAGLAGGKPVKEARCGYSRLPEANKADNARGRTHRLSGEH